MNLPNSNYLQVLILGGGYNGTVIVKGGVGRQGLESEESSGQGVLYCSYC